MADNDALLSVQNVAVAYGDALAVFDVTFEVRPGEIMAMLGPNGAGKTTTLLAIAGHLPLTRGSISLAAVDITGTPPHRLARAGVGFVPDDRALISGLTVSENLSMVRGGVLDPFDLFPELRRLAKRRAGLLSGGEQQMLAVARVLITRPRLLLIDELSLGLGPIVVRRLMTALRDAADEASCAVVLVEQHVEQALEVADRACVMLHGRIVLEGPTSELRNRRDLLEASYLGESVVRLD